MSRWVPGPEQFAVGAYLGLVEGYESVYYDSEAPEPRASEVSVLGRSEANQSLCFADLSHLLALFMLDLGERKMAGLLTERYRLLHALGRAMEYPEERIRCQVWCVRPSERPPRTWAWPDEEKLLEAQRRVERVLPRVKARLAGEHGIELEVVGREEAARRLRRAAQEARAQEYDFSNPFVSSVQIADGRLDYLPGEPLRPETSAEAQVFPLRLGSVKDIPRFVRQLLASREIVHWVGFQSDFCDALRGWFREKGVRAPLAELYSVLESLIEHYGPAAGEEYWDEEDEDYEEEEDFPWDVGEVSGIYTAHQLGEVTRLFLEQAGRLRRGLRGYMAVSPLCLDIRFMVPYLWRARQWADAAQIEREVVRFGGDRNTMMAHFAQRDPIKHPYRMHLYLTPLQPGDRPIEVTEGWRGMSVEIEDPKLDEKTTVRMWLEYRPIFTGYVLMVLRRVAEGMRL